MLCWLWWWNKVYLFQMFSPLCSILPQTIGSNPKLATHLYFNTCTTLMQWKWIKLAKMKFTESVSVLGPGCAWKIHNYLIFPSDGFALMKNWAFSFSDWENSAVKCWFWLYFASKFATIDRREKEEQIWSHFLLFRSSTGFSTCRSALAKLQC